MGQRRLLLINKFYHDVGPAGGVGRYLVQEEEDLAAAGWEVVPFAMADPEARPSAWSGHFVRARDYSRPRLGPDGLRDAFSLIWNREAARKLENLIVATRPAAAHLHNIYHHLSPSILPVLRRHRIPVVMTLHDLRLLCPAIHMLRDGHVCEKCKGGQYHQAVLGRCVKESRAASLLAAVETAHQRGRRLYEDGVETFLCPSRFCQAKYGEWGFPQEKLHHLPNFVDLQAWSPEALPSASARDAYLYFGRISHEKGIRFALEAQQLWERGYAEGTIDQQPLELLIAGTGPCDGNLRAKAAQLELRNVRILGALDAPAIREAMARSRFSILPSVCYENSPMAALESLASGVPLVGSRIGGIPEMIDEGVTGFTVAPGEPSAILSGLLKAAVLPDSARSAARDWACRNAGRVEHMAKLQGILEAAAGR